MLRKPLTMLFEGDRRGDRPKQYRPCPLPARASRAGSGVLTRGRRRRSRAGAADTGPRRRTPTPPATAARLVAGRGRVAPGVGVDGRPDLTTATPRTPTAHTENLRSKPGWSRHRLVDRLGRLSRGRLSRGHLSCSARAPASARVAADFPPPTARALHGRTPPAPLATPAQRAPQPLHAPVLRAPPAPQPRLAPSPPAQSAPAPHACGHEPELASCLGSCAEHAAALRPPVLQAPPRARPR